MTPDYLDPGWGEAFRGSFRLTVLPRALRHRSRVPQPNLVDLRRIFLRAAYGYLLLAAWLLLLLADPAAKGSTDASPLAPVTIAAAAAAAGLWWVWLRKTGIPRVARSRSLTAAYRSLAFSGLGLAETLAAYGVILAHLAGVTASLATLAIALVVLLAVAPSARNIMRMQARLTDAAGKPIHLGQTLVEAPAA